MPAGTYSAAEKLPSTIPVDDSKSAVDIQEQDLQYVQS